MNYSAKKIGNTISAMLLGAILGNILQVFQLLNPYLLGVSSVIFLLTFDWSKSLEEKEVELAHKEMDKKILKECLENKQIQQMLRKLQEDK